jgi:hypothetical protein
VRQPLSKLPWFANASINTKLPRTGSALLLRFPKNYMLQKCAIDNLRLVNASNTMTSSNRSAFLYATLAGKQKLIRSTKVAGAFAASMILAITSAQAQEIFDESFSTDTFKDPLTTAEWNTTDGNLRLPSSGSLSPIQSLNGTFSPASISAIAGNGETTRGLAAGDMDGDGDLDLVYANAGPNKVYFNNGFGVFIEGPGIPDDYFLGSNSRSVGIADFNGDGHLDAVFAEFGSSQSTRMFFNNGSGTTSIFSAGDFVDLGPPEFKGDSIAVGDIDNNGSIDVVLGVRGGFVKVFRNDGFGNFADAEDVVDSEGSTGFWARTVLLGDLDRDGDLDLVAARETEATRVYHNDGGVFDTGQSVGAGESNGLNGPDSVTLGDVNGDGLLDLVVGNDGTGTASFPAQPNRLYLNTGVAGSFFPAVSFTFNQLQNTNGTVLADVDRDGDLDLITADFLGIVGNGPNTGENIPGPNHLYINDPVANAPNIFPALGIEITADQTVSKGVEAADFDADGKIDLVFANSPSPVGGTPGTNLLVQNAGSLSGIPSDQTFAFGLSTQVNDPGDFLGNGVILLPNTNETEANQVFQYWVSSDGGQSWLVAHPGRSIAFEPVGNDLRWRVELNTPSPVLRPDLGQLRMITNQAPQFTSTAVETATQDQPYSYAISVSDLRVTDLLDIRAVDPLPTWLTLVDNNDSTATLSGTPTNADVGTVGNEVTLEVVDSGGRMDTQSFTIDVLNANDPPTVIAPTADQVFDQGDTVNLDTSLAFDDADGDVLTFSAVGLPASLAIDGNTGIVSGDLTNDDALGGPDYSVTITADDGNGGTADDVFTITVNNINDPPTFTSTEVTSAVESVTYTYNIITEDVDGDVRQITGTAPAWLTLTDNGDGTAVLTGMPTSANIGSANVTLTVSDGISSVDQAFIITVVSAADAPVITITGDNPVTVEQGDTYTDDGATAVDAQDGDLTGSITATDNVDPGTVGSYAVTYSVTDSAGNTVQAQRVVNVVDTAAPVITLVGPASVTLTVGANYTDQGATADDGLNGDISADIVVNNPVNTGVAGTYTVTYNVTDASGNAAAEVTRTVTVNTTPTTTPPPSGGGGGALSVPMLIMMLAGFLFGSRRRYRRTAI